MGITLIHVVFTVFGIWGLNHWWRASAVSSIPAFLVGRLPTYGLNSHWSTPVTYLVACLSPIIWWLAFRLRGWFVYLYCACVAFVWGWITFWSWVSPIPGLSPVSGPKSMLVLTGLLSLPLLSVAVLLFDNCGKGDMCHSRHKRWMHCSLVWIGLLAGFSGLTGLFVVLNWITMGEFLHGVRSAKMGSVAVRNRQWNEAESRYTEAIERIHDDPHLLLMRSYALTAKGHHARALEDVERALSLEESSEAYYQMGIILLRQGHVTVARSNLVRAIEIGDGNGVVASARQVLAEIPDTTRVQSRHSSSAIPQD